MIGEETIKEEVLSDNEDSHVPNLKHEINENDNEGYFSMSSDQDSINFDIKSPSAKDFFDIDEMAEDEVSCKNIVISTMFFFSKILAERKL